MDKLTVLNRALSNTGNTTLTVLNDGTDEWLVANTAFEEAVEDLITRHNWPFAQVSEDLVVAVDEDNPSKAFNHAFELPDDLIHVKRIRVNGFPTTMYEIVGRYACLDFDSNVAVEGYAMPAHALWHPQAVKILTMYVEAGCLRGLNEDFVAADKREMAAEDRLLEARPRVDRQNPARNAYISRINAARYTRRGTQPGLAVDRNATSPAPPAGSILLED